jgi:hypothetical protein
MSIIGATEVKKKLIGMIHLLREIPGLSAYEIAVKNGFRGTEAEWLASLSVKGDPGTLESHTEVDALGHRVVNVAEPVEDTDGATKKYVDDALGLEDISDKFVPYNAERFGNLGVYKQGKIISGTFAINHISISKDGGLTIATIQKGYRPITSGTAVAAVNVFNNGTVCDGIAAQIIDGGLLAISSNSDISNAYLEFSFTYICE